MRSLKLSLASALLLVGCSQILGLGDYEIDKTLDGDSSHAGGADDDGGSGGKSNGNGGRASDSGGKANDAGKTSTEAGDGPVSNGGKSNGNGGSSGTSNTSAGEGGEPPTPQGGKGGTGPIDEGGPGGEGGAPVTPGPELIPCDSVTCCTSKGGKPDAGLELLKDGGFELGIDGGVWDEVSTNDYDAITKNNPSKPNAFTSHDGDFFAYLSGFPGEETVIYSNPMLIPADAGWLTVSGYRYFQIDLMDAKNDDNAFVAFYDGAEGALDPFEVPFWWGNPTDYSDGWGSTNGAWKRFEASWDAAPHQSMMRQLGFRGSSDEYPAPTPQDDSPSSAYLFDSLSFKAYRCYK